MRAPSYTTGRKERMATQVAFLRAVNLGKRTARSAQLVDAFERVGFAGAWTFVNSGNVVFDATGSRGTLEQKLENAFEKALCGCGLVAKFLQQ